MHPQYHHLMTKQALAGHFSPAALRLIIKANLFQDTLASVIFHPERHFTENKLAGSLAYIEAQRALIVLALQNNRAISRAWQAFGRLLHTAQDFYAHTSYVRLWLENYNGAVPPPDQIEPLDLALMASSALYTTRSYPPYGFVGDLPGIGPWFCRFLQPDAHARMSLDAARSGPLFAYALAAATKRTSHEFNKTAALIGEPELLSCFTGRGKP